MKARVTLLFYSKLLTGIIYFYFLGLQTFMHDYQIFANISGFFTYTKEGGDWHFGFVL